MRCCHPAEPNQGMKLFLVWQIFSHTCMYLQSTHVHTHGVAHSWWNTLIMVEHFHDASLQQGLPCSLDHGKCLPTQTRQAYGAERPTDTYVHIHVYVVQLSIILTMFVYICMLVASSFIHRYIPPYGLIEVHSGTGAVSMYVGTCMQPSSFSQAVLSGSCANIV